MERREQLLETLLAVERENERLRTELHNASRLMNALEALLKLNIGEDLYSSFFRSLKPVFNFNQAMVLELCDDDTLECIIGTPKSLVGLRFPKGPLFEKVLKGRVSVTISNEQFPEWRDVDSSLISAKCAGLYAPLTVRNRHGLMVLLQPGGSEGFNRDHVALAKVYSVLASHVFAATTERQEILDNQARALAAEEGNKAKNLFIANMSHELRTPLNAIIGFSEIMTQEAFGPVTNHKYKEYVRLIYGGGQHLLSLVNDILLMAKIEAGQHRIKLEALDFENEVANVVSMTQIQADKRDVRIVTLPERPPVKGLADQISLQQVLLNLLGNAVKFSAEKGEVRIAYGCDANTYAPWISVIDDGCGIPPETLERLGKPFVQAEDVYARRNQGTGLGLAISFRLAEAMNARIKIDSEVGRGTRALLKFPPSAACEPAPRLVA